MEERGTGIRRMRRAMLDYGLEAPHVEVEDDRFVLTLYGPGDNLDRIHAPETESDALPESVKDEFNERQIKIAKRLAAGEELSSSQLQKDFSVTRETIARDMSLLIERGLARKAGKARATRYVHPSP
jgi:predicted HTH transcriptional regulator